MTSHRDSYTTTDVGPELIPGVETRNGIRHDKYDVRGISHARTDDIFMQRRLYIDEAHTALDIFPSAPPLQPSVVLVISERRNRVYWQGKIFLPGKPGLL